MGSKIKFKKDIFSIILVTAYLLLYCILLAFDSMQGYALMMLGFSPFLLVWMVYTILKHGKYNGPELGDEEFGYLDKKKDELGMF